ncbi:hypothetical protein [Dickeya solani]|uniref:hypothetical protein n=1 Tax=Dickeya solani TaxID=1089444 RepID=UPI0003C7F448|nr:hypothetical protein [Dickeya solani]
MKIKILDISRTELLSSKYDIAFIGLGYEPRCTYISKILDIDAVGKVVAFSFVESKENSNKIKSHEYLLKKWSNKMNMIELEHSNVKEVYSTLNKYLCTIEKDIIHILIDYSSMSRNWYSAILNYVIRFFPKKLLLTWSIRQQNTQRMMNFMILN